MTTDHDEQPMQIVGIDGSEASKQALDWALARVDLLGPVRPLLAWHYPWWALVPTAIGPMVPPTNSEFGEVAQRMARHAVDRHRGEQMLEPMVVNGRAGPSLVAAAGDGSVLVVGSRGRGSLASNWLGSVSTHCVHHAEVPVVVVPRDAAPIDQHDRVVVGIDGSEQSLAALRWAVDHTPSSSKIDIVHAWSNAATTAQVAAMADARQADYSATVIDHAIGDVRSQVELTGRCIEGHSVVGDPRVVLSAEADRSDLLVVGARGHGGLVHLLLGSTATAVTQQPVTATVVVR